MGEFSALMRWHFENYAVIKYPLRRDRLTAKKLAQQYATTLLIPDDDLIVQSGREGQARGAVCEIFSPPALGITVGHGHRHYICDGKLDQQGVDLGIAGNGAAMILAVQIKLGGRIPPREALGGTVPLVGLKMPAKILGIDEFMALQAAGQVPLTRPFLEQRFNMMDTCATFTNIMARQCSHILQKADFLPKFPEAEKYIYDIACSTLTTY